MNTSLAQKCGWMALAGLAVEALGFAWAVSLWNQTHPENYTILHNFVSELGAPKSSLQAQVFNATLILSGLFILPNLFALRARIRTRWSQAGIAAGLAAGVGAVGVGIYPMDLARLTPHLVAAMLFFWGSLFTVAFFSYGFWRKNSFRASPALLVSGVAVGVVTSVFLWTLCTALIGLLGAGSHVVPDGVLGAPIRQPTTFHRPQVWDIAILEWGVVITIFSWNLFAANYLLRSREP